MLVAFMASLRFGFIKNITLNNLEFPMPHGNCKLLVIVPDEFLHLRQPALED